MRLKDAIETMTLRFFDPASLGGVPQDDLSSSVDSGRFLIGTMRREYILHPTSNFEGLYLIEAVPLAPKLWPWLTIAWTCFTFAAVLCGTASGARVNLADPVTPRATTRRSSFPDVNSRRPWQMPSVGGRCDRSRAR